MIELAKAVVVQAGQWVQIRVVVGALPVSAARRRHRPDFGKLPRIGTPLNAKPVAVLFATCLPRQINMRSLCLPGETGKGNG